YVSGNSTKLEDLSPAEKRALLSQLVSENAHAPIRTAPLSYAQQRLWFLDQLMPGNPFYNEASAFRLRFPLNIAALERSLNEIVHRHETLRTTFQASAGEPAQHIAPKMTLELPVIDLSHLDEQKRETEALQLVKGESLRPFDLASGPLLRCQLVQLGPDEHIFILVMHHIVCDGWAMKVFFSELATIYPAFCADEPAPLPPLTVQYADYAVWQRSWLSGNVLADQLNYWRRQLADFAPLELPADYARPVSPSYQGGRLRFDVPDRVRKELEVLCEGERVTLFMLLLAPFQTLLFPY